MPQYDLDDYSLYGPCLLPCYPLPTPFFYAKMVVHHCARDAKCKSGDCFYKNGHWVFLLHEPQNLLELEQIMGVQKRCFWFGQDIDLGEALE